MDRKNLDYKCKDCSYEKKISAYWEKYWKDKYIGEKAAIIIKTATVMLLIQIAFISTVMLFKK